MHPYLGEVCPQGLVRLAAETRLPVKVPTPQLTRIADDIAAALTLYAAAHAPTAPQQPMLAETVRRGRDVSRHARASLKLLDADHLGPDGNLPAYVPVPGWLIADPARFVPGIDSGIALDSGEARGDAARAAMQLEVGMQLDAPTPFEIGRAHV